VAGTEGETENDSNRVSARETSKRSMAAIEAKDREAWLALFTEDGIVEDPIGPSIFDPDGTGHRGKEAIGRFFDTVIGPNDKLTFNVKLSYESGSEVANVGTIDITLPGGGQIASVDLVSTYRVAPDGRLESLRAYWEFEQMRLRDA
jgi:steroid Delta-isomerase